MSSEAHWQTIGRPPLGLFARENVEVHCSHTDMGWHPETLRVIADRPAQPEGTWRPYRAEDKAEDGDEARA